LLNTLLHLILLLLNSRLDLLHAGNEVKKETPLEIACFEVLGEEAEEYYKILSRLLILNPQFVEKDDNRLSAKISSILFNDDIQDKVHLMCSLIENDGLDYFFSKGEVLLTKLLLNTDPGLSITIEIIAHLKAIPGHNYSEIVQKVPTKHKREGAIRIFSNHYHIEEQQLRKYRNMTVYRD